MFDLWTHKYAAIGEAFLRAQLSLNTSRLTIIKGNSKITVPEYRQNNSNVYCDLLSIDGSHIYSDAMEDVKNMKSLANKAWNALFIDDTNCNKYWCVDKVIAHHEKIGNIRVHKRVSLWEGARGFTLMHYRFQHDNKSHNQNVVKL